MKRKLLQIGFFSTLVVTTSSAATFEWDAAWGWRPNDLIPGMTLIDSAAATDPVLTNGSLRLATQVATENMFYICTGTNFTAPGNLVIEARMRVLANSSSQPYRTAAVIGFSLAPDIGNTLFIGKDEIFLGNGHASRGTPAGVDTDDAFHTYRVEVDGNTTASAVRVYQDSILRLTGTLYQDNSDNGSDPRAYFGEGSSLAQGTNLWASFRHNGATQVSSVRPILSMTPNPTLGLHGIPGRTYQIDATTNLTAPAWTFRLNLTLPTNNAFGSTVLSPPLLPQEFFRAVESP